MRTTLLFTYFFVSILILCSSFLVLAEEGRSDAGTAVEILGDDRRAGSILEAKDMNHLHHPQ